MTIKTSRAITTNQPPEIMIEFFVVFLVAVFIFFLIYGLFLRKDTEMIEPTDLEQLIDQASNIETSDETFEEFVERLSGPYEVNDNYTVDQLYGIAKTLEIPGRSRMKKQQLIEAINA